MKDEDAKRVVLALESIAESEAELIRLATEERAATEEIADGIQGFKVPQCPHCGAVNPHTETKQADGKLSEFVLVTPCGSCGKVFYAIPHGWMIVATKAQAQEILEGKDVIE